MWFIYQIKSLTDKFTYIGITQNLKQRLKKHNEGATRSTKPYRPFVMSKIIKQCNVRVEARKWEKYYKSGIGREKLNKENSGIGAVG